MSTIPTPAVTGQFLVYQAEDGRIKIDVRLADETVWLPDGHFKFPHLWPVKFPQAGRLNYQLFSLSGSGFLSW